MLLKSYRKAQKMSGRMMMMMTTTMMMTMLLLLMIMTMLLLLLLLLLIMILIMRTMRAEPEFNPLPGFPKKLFAPYLTAGLLYVSDDRRRGG